MCPLKLTKLIFLINRSILESKVYFLLFLNQQEEEQKEEKKEKEHVEFSF